MLEELEYYSEELEKIFKFLGVSDTSKVQFKNLKYDDDGGIYFWVDSYYDDEFLFNMLATGLKSMDFSP